MNLKTFEIETVQQQNPEEILNERGPLKTYWRANKKKIMIISAFIVLIVGLSFLFFLRRNDYLLSKDFEVTTDGKQLTTTVMFELTTEGIQLTTTAKYEVTTDGKQLTTTTKYELTTEEQFGSVYYEPDNSTRLNLGRPKLKKINLYGTSNEIKSIKITDEDWNLLIKNLNTCNNEVKCNDTTKFLISIRFNKLKNHDAFRIIIMSDDSVSIRRAESSCMENNWFKDLVTSNNNTMTYFYNGTDYFAQFFKNFDMTKTCYTNVSPYGKGWVKISY